MSNATTPNPDGWGCVIAVAVVLLIVGAAAIAYGLISTGVLI